MPDKIMVTGANGMVGEAFCRLLENSNSKLVKVVRSNPGNDEISVGEIGSNTDWGDALEGVDIVVHTAARVHHMRDSAQDSELLYNAVNADGTLNLANQAAEKGVHRFIFLSTIKVLGETSCYGCPFKEDMALAPSDAYSRSKAKAEEGLLERAVNRSMEIVIIRSPLVYGPNVKGNFRKLLVWVNRGFPLPLASIDNKRTLISLDNLVDLIHSCLHHPAASNQVFFAGDGEDLSTSDLLKRIGKESGKPARLYYVPKNLLRLIAFLLGKEAVANRLYGTLQADISKARQLLDWTPPNSVNEGLRRAIAGTISISSFKRP